MTFPSGSCFATTHDRPARLLQTDSAVRMGRPRSPRRDIAPLTTPAFGIDLTRPATMFRPPSALYPARPAVARSTDYRTSGRKLAIHDGGRARARAPEGRGAPGRHRGDRG